MQGSGENYGIDAPTVVRNLAVAAFLCLVASTTAFALMATGTMPPTVFLAVLKTNGAIAGLICLAMAGWMILSSRVLKFGVARALLDMRDWRSDERVLDVGCGRGLVAVMAARRAMNGHVTGIDLWQERDLAGNGPDAIHANATVAGVAGRLTVDTGDARALPFPADAFDVVASMTAIHNIPDATGRTAAIAEAWRVTRPGGTILIFDIRHARTYADQLRSLGARVEVKGPILLWGPIGWRVAAHKPG